MTLNASATSCYRIMFNIKCLDKVSNERIYDLTGTSPLAIKSNLTTGQVPWLHLGAWGRMCMEKDANILRCMSSPPTPTPWEKTPRETAYVIFLHFCSYLKFLLVKTTSGWPLRSSAGMLHEIQVWLIIVGQPEIESCLQLLAVLTMS